MIAWLDMFSGVSGDMLLGACLDAGVPLEELQAAIGGLGLEGVRLGAERVESHGIAATRCLVEVPDAAGERHLQEILALLDAAELAPGVAARARRVFERLAEAEAVVHGTTPDRVHFHEVGALDAIVDVVGGVWCLERLGVETVRASRFALGGGIVDSAHGRLPIPGPAVLELVRGWPVAAGDVDAELTTPTGAALVTTLGEPGGPPADFTPVRVGYGAGTRTLPDRPNLLRLVLGTTPGAAAELVVLESDVDDLDPRLYEPAAEALEAAGARDVLWIPVQMKKRRPGVTIRALVPRDRLPAVGEALFRETSTLGYRWWPVAREVLAREADAVETSLGTVRVKRVVRADGGREVRPEYESAREIARARGLSVRDVLAALERELGARRNE